MAKGTGVRQREKKKKSSSLYYKEVACSSSVKPANEQKIKENLLTENFWKYCCFSLLLLLGVLCVLLSRNLRSSSHNSLYLENIGFPCNFGDEFSIDRRSNLSLEEFIYCYDAKRYLFSVLWFDSFSSWGYAGACVYKGGGGGVGGMGLGEGVDGCLDPRLILA